MTKIQGLENKLNKISTNLSHKAKLLVGLAPDPSKWEYTGEIIEMGENGKCVCGHAIRYGHVLELGKETKIVGSTCVEHFAEINPEIYLQMLDKQSTFETELLNAKKLQKQVLQQKEVEDLKCKHTELLGKIKTIYYSVTSMNVPFLIYMAWNCQGKYGLKKRIPDYTRSVDYIKFYTKEIEKSQFVLDNYTNGVYNYLNYP